MNEILTLINLLGDYKRALLYAYLQNKGWGLIVSDYDILSDLKFSTIDLVRARGELMSGVIQVEYLPGNMARHEIRGIQ
jgi:hypothetical protein|nr:MAG TPA: hypothetical protein [Caudoviricetes sp.]